MEKEKKVKPKKEGKKRSSLLIKLIKENSISKFEWLLPCDADTFVRKRLIKALYYFVILATVSGVGYFLTVNVLAIKEVVSLKALLIGSLVIAIAVYKKDYLKYLSLFNKQRKDVYQAFPSWVATLEILIMSNNIVNTFKKSIETCPYVFRKELSEFVEEIEYNPENKDAYKNFLNKYSLQDVHEIIMDMYGFNSLDKQEIVKEFRFVNERLNKIVNETRQARQARDLFMISALNSIPIMTASIYILVLAMKFAM